MFSWSIIPQEGVNIFTSTRATTTTVEIESGGDGRKAVAMARHLTAFSGHGVGGNSFSHQHDIKQNGHVYWNQLLHFISLLKCFGHSHSIPLCLLLSKVGTIFVLVNLNHREIIWIVGWFGILQVKATPNYISCTMENFLSCFIWVSDICVIRFKYWRFNANTLWASIVLTNFWKKGSFCDLKQIRNCYRTGCNNQQDFNYFCSSNYTFSFSERKKLI